MVKSVLVLSENGIRYKVSKLIFYGEDSGFGILAPYHAAKEGYLLKYTAQRNKLYGKYEDGYTIKSSDTVPYTATDRVKLSIHSDGFVQFSGENPGRIISGKDPITGDAKGLGLFSSPLSKPIISGPTFVLTIWGLYDFTVIEKAKSGEIVTEFSEKDYIYRETDAAKWNAYQIEGFVFPLHFSLFAFQNDSDDMILNFKHPEFQHEYGNTITFRMLPFYSTKYQYILALLVSRATIDIANDSPSGFILSPPTQIRQDLVTGLQAFYPNINPLDNTSQSLDYKGSL
jgi:hypothetical protein